MMSSVICCVCFVPRAHRPARRDCAVVSRVPAHIVARLRGFRSIFATFLTRPSNDKFQAGRHHPYMGEFERVNRFLFDRRNAFLAPRAPRSR